MNNTQLRGHVIDNIPINLHASFQILNTLKHKRNKTATKIERLTNYQNDGILPDGLNNITNCNIILDDDLHSKWVKASLDAAKVQLNVLLEQHQHTLTNIEFKIEHSTKRITNICTDKKQPQKILNATDQIGKRYTSRQLNKTNKANTAPNA